MKRGAERRYSGKRVVKEFTNADLHCTDFGMTPILDRSGYWEITLYAEAKIMWYDKPSEIVRPEDPIRLWQEDRALCLKEIPPVDPEPAKRAGMQAAYEHQIPARLNFENLLAYICSRAKPDQIIDTGTVWSLWDNLHWPKEGFKRQFAGNVMPAAVKRGWLRPVTKVKDTAGRAHSGIPNTGYLSIWTGPPLPMPEYLTEVPAE